LDEEHQVAAAAVMLLQTSCFLNVMYHKTKIVSANSGIALSSSSSSFVKVLFFTKAQIALLICTFKKLMTKPKLSIFKNKNKNHHCTATDFHVEENYTIES
jgi:hypothetical protein